MIEQDNLDNTKKLIDNVYYSIFHFVRWAMRCMGEFIKSEELSNFEGYQTKQVSLRKRLIDGH